MVDEGTAGSGGEGLEHERDKFARTTDADVAAINGFEYMTLPVAIENHHSGAQSQQDGTLIKRMSRNREMMMMVPLFL